MKFKVGDLVKRKSEYIHPNLTRSVFKEGVIYKVSGVKEEFDHQILQLEEVNGDLWWFSYKFELAEPLKYKLEDFL